MGGMRCRNSFGGAVPLLLAICWERSMTKDYLLSVVRRILEELVNNRPVDHLEKCGFFSDV